MEHPFHDDTDRYEEIAQVYTGGYDWGIACVWLDKTTGRLYGDTDEGCSCYGPFESDCAGLEDLIDITHERDAAGLLDKITDGDDGPSTEQRQTFVRSVRDALKSKA